MPGSDALQSSSRHSRKSRMPRFLPFELDHRRKNVGLLLRRLGNDCLRIVRFGAPSVTRLAIIGPLKQKAGLWYFDLPA
jgi:hypothetical protein